MSAGKAVVVCVCTLLVGLIVISVAVVSSCFMMISSTDSDHYNYFQRWFLMKRSSISEKKINDLFEGDNICDWDGVNCAKFEIVLSNISTHHQVGDGERIFKLSSQQHLYATTTNTSTDHIVEKATATSSSSSSSSSSDQVQKSSSLKDSTDDMIINDWGFKPQGFYPALVMLLLLLEG